MSQARRTYEVRPRKDKRDVDLISDALPFRRLYYGEPNAVSNAVDYAKFLSRSRDAAFSEKTGSAPGRFKNIGPKPIGLRSYLRLSGVLIKFSLITLPRRFNASSVGLKPVGGLTFAETPLARSPDSTGAQSHLKRGRC